MSFGDLFGFGSGAIEDDEPGVFFSGGMHDEDGSDDLLIFLGF